MLKRVADVATVLRAWGNDEQMSLAVARVHLRRPLSAEAVDQARPPQLPFVHPHEDVPGLEHGQAVPRDPGLGSGLHEGVLGGLRLGSANPGVDAGGVGVQHGPGLRVQSLVVCLDRAAELEPPHLDVLVHGDFPDQLGQRTVRGPAVLLHVPEPVLGRGEPLPEEGVVGRLSLDVGDAVGVAIYLHGGIEAFETVGRRRIGKSGDQVLLGQALRVHALYPRIRDLSA